MLLFLFITTFTTLTFTMFNFSIRISCINRIVSNTPKALVESSIPLFGISNNILSFDKELLESGVKDYYTTNLSKYTKKFSIDFYYYNIEDFSLCTNEECNGVEITVNSNFILNYNYHRTIFFEIRKGGVYANE